MEEGFFFKITYNIFRYPYFYLNKGKLKIKFLQISVYKTGLDSETNN